MNKVLSACIAAAALAGAAFCAFADDDAAYSANAVGVVKYTIPSNAALTCVSLPLDPLDGDGTGTWVWGETQLAKDLPVNSIVYFWNAEDVCWDPYTKGSLWGWIADARNHEIKRGEAFFIQGPYATTNRVISMLGQLPVEENYVFNVPSNTLQVFSVTPYPVKEGFGGTDLASGLPTNSVIYFWNGGERVWDPYSKGKLWGWNAEAKAHTNFVGEGVFIKASEDVGLTITRPFDWE